MQKKAQGLSLNFVIIAIILILVVVVIVAIFTGVFNNTTTTLASCETAGGECFDKTDPATPCEEIISGENLSDSVVSGSTQDSHNKACQRANNDNNDKYRCCPAGYKVKE